MVATVYLIGSGGFVTKLLQEGILYAAGVIDAASFGPLIHEVVSYQFGGEGGLGRVGV